jgi:hypothetical protein
LIARHASKVEGRHRNNEVKEAILLRRRRRRRRSDTCDDICSNCGEVCGEIWVMSQNSKKYGYFSFKYSLEFL